MKIGKQDSFCGTENMRMVIDPGFAGNPVCNTPLWVVKMASVLSQEYKGLIKYVVVDRPLNTVGAEVWIWAFPSN